MDFMFRSEDHLENSGCVCHSTEQEADVRAYTANINALGRPAMFINAVFLSFQGGDCPVEK